MPQESNDVFSEAEEYVLEQISKRGIYHFGPSEWDRVGINEALDLLIEMGYIRDCTDVGSKMNECYNFRLTGTKAAWVQVTSNTWELAIEQA